MSDTGITSVTDKWSIYVFVARDNVSISYISEFNSVPNASLMHPFDENERVIRSKEVLYIGEADDTCSRLNNHLGDPDGNLGALRLKSKKRQKYKTSFDIYVFIISKNIISMTSDKSDQSIVRKMIETKIKSILNPCCGD